MICPFYKNKEVFDGFNEIIEALGGKPMTEEEFRSAELRNQRTGRDFSAMEAAYTAYDRNGGNFLDMTPTGQPSILFQTLLDYFKGDRTKAIVAKTNVYSDEFFNWFGDWINDSDNASEVTDQNGEPLVVWHGSRDKFTKFKNDSYADGIYFSSDRQYIEQFGDIYYPVYLSIKNPNKTDIPLSHESVESLLTVDYIKGQDGIIGHDAVLDIRPSRGTEYVALRPNQIKHIENLGTWSPTDNDINKIVIGERGASSLDREQEVTTRIDNLAIAKEMENSGSTAIEIKIATGWERGADGKWRYEIPDIQLKVDEFGFKSIYDAVGNYKESAIERPIEEVIDLSTLPENYREELEYVGYIQIYSDSFDPERGSYDIKDGKVVFTLNLYYDETGVESARSILVHELQHFIQEREGFSQGGNPDSAKVAWLKQNGLLDEYRKLNKELIKNSPGRLLNKILSKDDLYVKYYSISQQVDQATNMIDDINAQSEEDVIGFIKNWVPAFEPGVNYDDLAEQRKNELISIYKRQLDKAGEVYDEIQTQIDEIQNKMGSSFELYKRLAGETEARTAAERIYLSESERRASLFTEDMYKDVAKEDLIFLQEGEESLNKNIPVTRTVINGQQFENASLSDFDFDVMSRLTVGEQISSNELIDSFIINGSLSLSNTNLAQILKRHNIPVKLDASIGTLTLATTVTDKSSGESIILLNPSLINQVTKGYLGEAILHEVIHAVTVNAINKPSNAIEEKFAKLNKKVFDKLSSFIPAGSALLNDVDLGTYALTNEKEFAAVFITDDVARNTFISIAKKIDEQTNGKFINTFKNFINSIVHLFVNKNVFNTNEALLKQYQTNFFKYLKGIPVNNSVKLSSESLKRLYDSIDPRSVETEALIDKMKFLQQYSDAVERNNIITVSLGKNKSQQDNTYSFDDIIQKLQIRINALRTSDLDVSDKNKYINDTNTQVEMFRNQQTSKYIAITSTLRQVIPQLLKDVRELKNIKIDDNLTISGKEYMYHMHSNIKMYENIGKTMLNVLDQNSSEEQIIQEYNRNLPDDQKITIRDIEELRKSIRDLISVAAEGESVLLILRNRAAKDILIKKAEKEGDKEGMEEYLKNITENPTFDDDISFFEKNFGSMDSASNKALNALYSIVNRALQKADDAVIDKGTTLLERAANLKFGESVVDLYETDEHGLTTGYLIRKLNYGKFYKNYDKELKRINKVISDALGIKIEDKERIAPQGKIGETILTDQQVEKLNLSTYKDIIGENGNVIRRDHIEWSARQAWNELRNIWLYENCERKYNKKYYDAWNKVPQVAKDALDSINAEISAILSQDGIKGSDGYYHYDKLNEKDWNQLESLWIQKKLLRSDYDMFGNLKLEGSEEYKIAKALQQLNKDLYGDSQQKIKKDKDAWLNALNIEINACGGKSAYDKWINGEKNHGFNSKRFKMWHMRNSRLEFKKDANGEAIIFKDIEQAMQGMKVDYGPQYDKLTDQVNELLKPYRTQNGEVNASEIPDAVKNIINEIYSKQYEIRQEVLAENPALRQMSKKYKNVFDQFIKFVDTEYFKQIKRGIEKASLNEEGFVDEDLKDSLLEQYGTYSIDYESGLIGDFRPYRWLQRMEAIDLNKYMEYQPGDAWTEKVDNEDLLNKNFDENEGTSFVPKKSKYDNSKAFSKIEKSPTLMALYKEVVKTMEEANAMQSNRLYTDKYLLPQITGTIWKRMKNHTAWGKLKVLFNYFFESLGIGYNPNDFSEIGSNMALDLVTSEGDQLTNVNPIKGQYPDGRTFHIMPQYYTRKMDDPSQIDSDLIKILTNYYRMSCYYKERVAIKDDCETIVDFLEERGKKRPKTQFTNTQSGGSKVYQAAEKFLEMNLYDVKRSSTSFKVGPIEVQWSKTVGLWKTWTTRRNLGMNPKVALTGFLTSIGVHILETITGQHYGREGYMAFGEAIRRLFQSILGARYLGNPLSNDDMILMAEHYKIAGQAERKFEGTNRNRLLNIVDRHGVFGFLSTVDFWTKSIIMTSILMNHHYIDGKFLSREDMRNQRYLYNSKKEFNEAMKEWRRGPSLYSLLKSKNNRLTIDDKSNQDIIDKYNSNLKSSKKITLQDLKNAFDSTDEVIKDRVLKTAEYADGMATPLQRAAVSQSIIGALILIHKQYLPLILQRYFGKRVYDYDTHQYKNGLFRTFFNFIGELMQNNLIAGIGAGAFTGMAFLGTSPFIGIALSGTAIGAIAGASVRAYGVYKHKKGVDKKSIKDIWNEYFNDFHDKKSTQMSYANRYAIKNVTATVLGYKLIVQPLVALACSIADDDDDNTWWLQLLAYSLRAFEWEYYTAFRSDDMLNNVKSPTAATSILDGLESMGQSVSNTISPFGNLLFDPSQTWNDLVNRENSGITNGAYEGWLPIERDIVKLTAFHNLHEQLKNSKAKRKYLENQIMRIKKPE